MDAVSGDQCGADVLMIPGWSLSRTNSRKLAAVESVRDQLNFQGRRILE